TSRSGSRPSTARRRTRGPPSRGWSGGFRTSATPGRASPGRSPGRPPSRPSWSSESDPPTGCRRRCISRERRRPPRERPFPDASRAVTAVTAPRLATRARARRKTELRPGRSTISKTVITGFNTDVKHKNRVFHIQTEDKGEANPYVESLVYVGGEILATKKTSYAEVVKEGRDDHAIQDLMEQQHRTMIAAIQRGRFDGPNGSIQIPEGMAPTVPELGPPPKRPSRASSSAAARAAKAGAAAAAAPEAEKSEKNESTAPRGTPGSPGGTAGDRS